MSNQERIREQGPGRRQVQGESTQLPGGQQDAEDLASGLGSTNAALDDILADYVSDPEPTAAIIHGASPLKHRPELRQRSNEEFVRAFQQRGGQ
ncbi:MAG: hypothetical protein HN904_05340 [Victivallales bacterium]|jgi:hypothetical protein|nr:hypothetical protein [Victivallales bacterium]